MRIGCDQTSSGRRTCVHLQCANVRNGNATGGIGMNQTESGQCNGLSSGDRSEMEMNDIGRWEGVGLKVKQGQIIFERGRVELWIQNDASGIALF